MLAAIDKNLDDEQQQQCSGAGEAGTLTGQEAQAALASGMSSAQIVGDLRINSFVMCVCQGACDVGACCCGV